MGCKAAMQVLKQADVLKAKLSKSGDLLNDSEIWTNQQQLQTIYHQVLVLDLEYALDKKVEQELWTLGFKNHISTLQEMAKDKKNPKRQDSQALLSWCLEAASGFYLTLLHELCTTFDLDLPFRRNGVVYGQLKSNNNCEQVIVPQSSSCLYICQYCLVHLGDIARYRNQRYQAESFYKQAIVVSPTSGQPYNQLALLEASQSDRLSTVFHYVRAIAVKNPFPVSATNLSTTLSSAMDKDEPLVEIQTKMSANKLLRTFLHTHGLLNSAIDLKQAEVGVKSINATLTALVATQSFSADKLIKMTVINMYALWKIVGVNLKNNELTEDEIKVRELILDLIAGSLSAFLLPIYTLKNDDTLLDYYAMPAIRLICCWIEEDPNVLNESVFTSRLQIWPGFCKLLNDVQEHLKDFKYEMCKEVALCEDKELQGFLPLTEAFKGLNFKLEASEGDQKLIRVQRLINFGVVLTKIESNQRLIICVKNGDFKPGCIQPDPTDQLLELMKSVNVLEVQEVKKVKGEKRTGILKPQGSLERSREEREQQQSELQNQAASKNRVDNAKLKRVKQNVALQSIFKKIEENKQVKFSEETTIDKEMKEKEVEKPKHINKNLGVQNQHNNATNQYRTQTFNQNHPGLSSNLHQDFFNKVNINENMYFSNLQKDNKIPPNLQFPHPPPPIQQPPNHSQNLQQNPPQINYSIPKPPPNYQQPPMMLPNLPPFQNLHGSGYRNWTNDERGPPPPPPQQPQPQNWWSNQQPPKEFQQRDQFGNVPPYFQQKRMEFNHQGQQQSGMFMGGWNGGRNPPQLMGYPPGQGMSMRQAMLNEAKHMGSPNNMQKPNDAQPQPSQNPAPGYSLFDPNWNPTSLTHLRTQDISQNRPPTQHPSLFSGPPHNSLLQLLEQQNKYQKPDK
nr:protein SMG7-like [Onthophagus taurus]